MNREQALLLEAHRKLGNNFKFQTELNRILKTQVEPAVYTKAMEQARIICQKRFKKTSPEVAAILKSLSTDSLAKNW